MSEQYEVVHTDTHSVTTIDLGGVAALGRRHPHWGYGEAFRRLRVLFGWTLVDVESASGIFIVDISSLERGYATLGTEGQWRQLFRIVVTP